MEPEVWKGVSMISTFNEPIVSPPLALPKSKRSPPLTGWVMEEMYPSSVGPYTLTWCSVSLSKT